MGEFNGKYHVRTLGIGDYQALTACQNACPLGTDTKGYLKAIMDGDYEKAYLVARQSNPLVSVCSRVCTAPCETSCRKADADSPVSIRALKRFACDQYGVASPQSVARRLDALSQGSEWVSDRPVNHILTLSKKGQGSGRVAIIGSGPAGLSAAHDLAVLGYQVTVFDAAPVAGGQLTTGIPGFRLPKEIVQQEIEAILQLGVELQLNSPIGQDRSLADLRKEGFRAVYITIGLQDPMKLHLEGTELQGVYSGIDYVREHQQIAVGQTCLVIGGGGVAIDCAQHAVRQGAKKVMIACLESWEQMPASLSDKEDAQEEGDQIPPFLRPGRILGRQGKVAGVEFLKVRWVFDENGAFNPIFIHDSITVLQTDTVILAVGQSSPSLRSPVWRGWR